MSSYYFIFYIRINFILCLYYLHYLQINECKDKNEKSTHFHINLSIFLNIAILLSTKNICLSNCNLSNTRDYYCIYLYWKNSLSVTIFSILFFISHKYNNNFNNWLFILIGYIFGGINRTFCKYIYLSIIAFYLLFKILY